MELIAIQITAIIIADLSTNMPASEPTTKASKWTSDRGRDRRLSVQGATDLRRDDHLPERGLEFIPLWGFLVFLLYGMRRVDCRDCGVVVEEVPWSDGKHQLTRAYMLFLARWARTLSWKKTAEPFTTPR